MCGSPSEDLFGYLHNMMSAGAVLLPTQESFTVPLSVKRIFSRILKIYALISAFIQSKYGDSLD